MLASACPGWVCYAEKTQSESLLPFIASTKSPQAVMGSLVKRVLAPRLGVIDPAKLYHCTVMPCYDKKLEASRTELTLEGTQAQGASGGYADFVFRTAAEQLFGRHLPPGPLPYQTLRNADFQEVLLRDEASGEVLLRCAIANGFRNIQTLMRKIRMGRCEYDYIEVRLKEYGSQLIEVSDNGSGVKAEDYQALTLKYHTSKLQTFADLAGLNTFGFRGEALSSLCALAHVSVVTCTQGQEAGVRLEYAHSGQLVSQEPCPRAVGTTVALKALFSTLPVRHK
ncbi:DNA_mis_repair domain-containing protein, partial [Haematococcus lacustris]